MCEFTMKTGEKERKQKKGLVLFQKKGEQDGAVGEKSGKDWLCLGKINELLLSGEKERLIFTKQLTI